MCKILVFLGCRLGYFVNFYIFNVLVFSLINHLNLHVAFGIVFSITKKYYYTIYIIKIISYYLLEQIIKRNYNLYYLKKNHNYTTSIKT